VQLITPPLKKLNRLFSLKGWGYFGLNKARRKNNKI
jgi:hypothetical protein